MGGFQSNIGVTLEEKVRNALQLGSSVSVRNIGLAMARKRGVPNVPFLFNDNKAELTLFGGKDSSMYSPYVCSTLFDNLGGYGVNIYGLRIVGAGSAAATVTLKNQADATQNLAVTVVTAPSTGVKQKDLITISGAIDAGDIATVTLSGVSITYTALAGDDINDVAAGLRTAVLTYQAANTGSSWATTGVVSALTGATFTYEAAVADTAFTLTGSFANVISASDILDVTAGRQGAEDPGTWGNGLSIRAFPKADPNGDPTLYTLDILLNGIMVEHWLAVDWTTMINLVNTQSEYVMLTAINASQVLQYPFTASLTGGTYNAPVQADFEPTYNETTGEAEGMAIFETVDVQLIACPEIFALNYHIKCNTWAEQKKKFYIFNMPYNATESQVTNYYNSLFTGDASFTAGYLQWIQVDDGNGGLIWTPSLGYVLGAGYIRACGLNNGRVWTPPAGTQTVSKNIYQFSHSTLSDSVISRYVMQWHINVVKFIKQTGWVLWSSRTYSDNALHQSIHVRLETNWMGQSLIDRGAKFIQKLITATFLREVKVDYLAFMQNVYNQGGIENTVSFDDAVVVTVTVNPEDRKQSDIDVSWIPPECNEKMHITLTRNDGILNLV
jgi:hypothetical protein